MATWSQKTYEMVASALHSARTGKPVVDHGIDLVIWRLIEEFEDDNDAFNRELFLVAAGWHDDEEG